MLALYALNCQEFSGVMRKLTTTLTILIALSALMNPLPAFAEGNPGDGDTDGQPVISQWSDPAAAGRASSQVAAVQECWGHFNDVHEDADGAQWGGYTQCNGAHDLTLRMALYRWNSNTGSYKFITSVYNQRVAWYVGAFGNEPCGSQLSTRYKMRAFPTMDGIQMAGYGGWSDPYTITCRVPWT